MVELSGYRVMSAFTHQGAKCSRRNGQPQRCHGPPEKNGAAPIPVDPTPANSASRLTYRFKRIWLNFPWHPSSRSSPATSTACQTPNPGYTALLRLRLGTLGERQLLHRVQLGRECCNLDRVVLQVAAGPQCVPGRPRSRRADRLSTPSGEYGARPTSPSPLAALPLAPPLPVNPSHPRSTRTPYLPRDLPQVCQARPVRVAGGDG
jgi:hypothetical protein